MLIIIFLVILGMLLAYFVWNFFRFYGQIQRGELSTAEVAFLDKFTTTDRLRTQLTTASSTDTDVRTADDPQFGTPEAALVIVEFADFGCPWSREESFIIRELATRYADRILYIYRDFPIDELHPNARRAAEAGECAEELGNFWAYHDKLYQNQDRLEREDLIRYAIEIGLPETAFTSCLDSGKYAAEVQEDYDAGAAAGVRGTPTFFLNGKRIEGAIPRNVMEEIFQAIT